MRREDKLTHPGAELGVLRPEATPDWLRPALGVDSADTQRRIGANTMARQMKRLPAMKKESAVLILLKGTSVEDAEVLLTHRSPSMRSHSGQIAFPGGRRDPEDATLVDVALREAWEETGLDPRSVTPLEKWEELHIRATGNPVHPVLAYWHEPGEVWPASPEETDDVFLVPVRELIEPENRFMVGLGPWKGPAFHVRDYVVWGFTGGILATLLDHAGWSLEWDNNSVHELRDTLKRSRNNEKMI
ncbi:CoA pyrophosphatase [Corynebacterium sp.]|uniref:NUDIX hydrolase n=1 Tax=Corynebacterium sp. TaxID=1720 RepID=UPI0026DC2D6D|nr:CoA pyrophosphatase [Corynebacterium sp.]MDO5031856.1 CoA pyrophosphatase [Corynebacterium sp.]